MQYFGSIGLDKHIIKIILNSFDALNVVLGYFSEPGAFIHPPWEAPSSTAKCPTGPLHLTILITLTLHTAKSLIWKTLSWSYSSSV